MDPKPPSKKNNTVLHLKNLNDEAKVIKTLIFRCVSASGAEFISRHEASPFPLRAAGDGSCRANESPGRSDSAADRTGRPITWCAPHQLFWHISWWGRCHLTAAMEPLWWRWSHVLWCANCSNLLVLGQLLLPHLWHTLLLLHLLCRKSTRSAWMWEEPRDAANHLVMNS